MDKSLMEQLVEDLAMHAKFKAEVMPNGFNFERWLLDNGEPFGPMVKRPKGVHLKQRKMCFMNATKAVLYGTMGSDDWVYCEGKALPKGMPMTFDHAWLAHRETGDVIDLTWRYKPGEAAYFGVPFTRKYMLESIMERGVYGLFSDGCMFNEALVKAKPKTYRAYPKKG